MKTLNHAALVPLYQVAMMLKSRYDGSSQTLQHPSPAPNHFYRLTDDDRKQLQSALTLAEQPGEVKDHEQRAQEFVTAFEDHESGPIEDAETRIELCRLFVKAQDDATATLAAQLAEYQARARRWYQPHGTFVELTEDEVIEKRKQAAKDLAQLQELRDLVREYKRRADALGEEISAWADVEAAELAVTAKDTSATRQWVTDANENLADRQDHRAEKDAGVQHHVRPHLTPDPLAAQLAKLGVVP